MRTSVVTMAAAALVLGLSLNVLAQERPTTTWTPAYSGNYSSGRSARIDTVVIHTIEGSAQAGISWFQNSSSNVSAHYVIAYSGQIFQCVADSNTAWHVIGWNSRSIGLEHEGFAGRNNWTDAQYRASARLTAWLCATYGVPRTRTGIRGHNELDPARRSDPGAFFNWTYYMQLVGGSNPSPSPTPTPTPTPSLTAQQVNASSLSVRSGAGTGFSIIGTVRSGQIYVSNTLSNGWHRIYYDNRQGWCSAQFLTRRTGGIGRRVTASSLNVRSGPSTSNSIVGSCWSGEVFVADTTQSGWLRIWYRGAQYWISAQYTTTVQF